MIAQQLLNGLVVGSVYALFALGFTLIFGVHHILNLAHGAVFMWGAFVGLYAITGFDLPFPLGFVLAAIGWRVCSAWRSIWIAFRPLRQARRAGILARSSRQSAPVSILMKSPSRYRRHACCAIRSVLFRSRSTSSSACGSPLLQIMIVVSVAADRRRAVLLPLLHAFGRQIRAVAVNERTARCSGSIRISFTSRPSSSPARWPARPAC